MNALRSRRERELERPLSKTPRSMREGAANAGILNVLFFPFFLHHNVLEKRSTLTFRTGLT